MIKYAYLLTLFMASSLYAAQAAEATQPVEYDQTVFARTGRKIDINRVDSFVVKVHTLVDYCRKGPEEWQRSPFVDELREAYLQRQEKTLLEKPSYPSLEILAMTSIVQEAAAQFYAAMDCYPDLVATRQACTIRPIQEANALLDNLGLSLATLQDDEQAIMKTYATGAPSDNLTFDRQKNNSCRTCGKPQTELTATRCSRCQVTRYCSVTCQRAHWNDHRKVCK